MPMFGVMRETLEREFASISGEEDFFSVARTMPFVAVIRGFSLLNMGCGVGVGDTFDPETGYSLVYCVEGIFYLYQFAAGRECC